MVSSELTGIIDCLITQESLPASYADTVRHTLLPLAQHIQSLRQERGQAVLVGIHGAQGTGKSTLTLFLKELLTRLYRVPTASVSIDDLYLTRAERESLAAQAHPLLITRGVPGTHDLQLGQRLIDQLSSAAPDAQTPIPAFDKSRDDRAPMSEWPVFEGRAQVILLEGWCVGALPAKSDDALNEPVNRLEAQEDPDVVWRKYVNEHLKSDYSRFFEQIDCLVMLKAPSMECVLEWRTLQERKLRSKKPAAPKQGDSGIANKVGNTTRIMTDDQIARFIMHYERISRACLEDMPARADVLIHVDENHNFSEPLIRQRQ